MRMKQFLFFIILSIFSIFGCSVRYVDYYVDSQYLYLRDNLFKLNQNTITNSDSTSDILGFLMETGSIKGSYTLISLSDGTISMYFSGGGAIIGIGTYDKPSQISKELLSLSSKYRNQMKSIKKDPLPKKNKTRFYLLTTNGKFSIEVPEEKLIDKSIELSELYYKAHDLITEIRLIDTQNRKNSDNENTSI